jgi:hypothetical protein
VRTVHFIAGQKHRRFNAIGTENSEYSAIFSIIETSSSLSSLNCEGRFVFSECAEYFLRGLDNWSVVKVHRIIYPVYARNTTHLAIGWVAPLLYILEVPESVPENGSSEDFELFLSRSRQMSRAYFKLGYGYFFNVLFNSLFINHPVIWVYIDWDTDSIVK